MSESHKGKHKTGAPKKPVICYNNYGIIKVYIKLTDTKKDGFCVGRVCQCCKGQIKSHKDYQFRYATEEDVN
jgi:hypothetical protein